MITHRGGYMAAFKLKQVVPWGRSFDEYCRMFALTEADLGGRILGCGDGPASFNAEANRRGARVLSCDPLYQLDARQICERIAATFDEILEQTRRNRDAFVWRTIADPEELGRTRMAAMERFLDDYEDGRVAGRYVAANLPSLPLADGSFDLALCSHLLFLYSEHLSREFHVQSALELCRVAQEVRIFPLLTLAGARSPFADAVVAACEAAGASVSMATVDYEFQRGGNEMLRIRQPR